jgi:hypothetical protein
MNATNHFIERVAERIGPHVDARALARWIVDAIRKDRTDLVEYVSRVSRDGKRVFRFRLRDEVFFVLVDTQNMQCVTVFRPGFAVGREGRSKIILEGSQKC